MSDQLETAMADLEEATVLKLVRQRLDAGENPMTILQSCREGMTQVGKHFEACEYFVSELVMATEIFKQATALLTSRLKKDIIGTRGKVVIGTVKGDIHDIGKDIVVSLLKAANYDMRDLGVDVPPQKIVDAVKETVKYHQIIGVHMIGPRVSDLIAEATLAMKLEITPGEITSTFHSHPTLSEGFWEAARDICGR